MYHETEYLHKIYGLRQLFCYNNVKCFEIAGLEIFILKRNCWRSHWLNV